MDLNRFRDLPLMGIVRGVAPEALPPLIEAVSSAGLQTLEITMNTPGAPELIRQAVKLAGNRLTIGAGTVLSAMDLRAALDAGATFVVLPTLVEDVVGYCKQHDVPIFPGALTPQEILNAWRAGASMVKVFPSKFFGPDYFKEIKGPFQDIELLACGGVTPENLSAYRTAGASAFAIGGSVFKPEWMEKGEFGKIQEALQKYVSSFPR